MVNSEIIGNKVSFYATISSFYYYAFNMLFLYCNISHNHGTSVGAAYAALHFDGLVYFNHTHFENNTVEINTFLGGPVILLYGVFSTQIFTKNCTYINNFSSKNGGVLNIEAGEMFDSDSIYINNTAISGGAINIFVYSSIEIKNGLFEINMARYGGAISASGVGRFIIENTMILNNHAKNGAGLSIEGFQKFVEVLIFIEFFFK